MTPRQHAVVEAKRTLRRLDKILAELGDCLDSGELLRCLELLGAARDLSESMRAAVVDGALVDGHTWREIAAALDVPTTTAFRRYGPE